MFNNNWTVRQYGFEPFPKDRRQFESQKNGHSEWWGKQGFSTLVKSFHSYKQVDSRSQTLMYTLNLYAQLWWENQLLGKWREVRNSWTMPSDALSDICEQGKGQLYTVKLFRDDCNPSLGPLASPWRLRTRKQCTKHNFTPCRLHVIKLHFVHCFLIQ